MNVLVAVSGQQRSQKSLLIAQRINKTKRVTTSPGSNFCSVQKFRVRMQKTLTRIFRVFALHLCRSSQSNSTNSIILIKSPVLFFTQVFEVKFLKSSGLNHCTLCMPSPLLICIALFAKFFSFLQNFQPCVVARNIVVLFTFGVMFDTEK